MPRGRRQDIIRKVSRGINLSETIVEHLSAAIENFSQGIPQDELIIDYQNGNITLPKYRYAEQLAPLIGLVVVQIEFQSALEETIKRI